MVIKNIKGGTSSIVDYVTKNSTAQDKTLISGNIELTKEIIKNSNFNENYYHWSIAQNDNPNISLAHWKVIAQVFDDNFYMDMDRSEHMHLTILHDEEHLHIITPKMNLETLKDSQLYYDPIDQHKMNLIRDLLHKIDWAAYGLDDPKLLHPLDVDTTTSELKSPLDLIIAHREDQKRDFSEFNLGRNKDKKIVSSIVQRDITKLFKSGGLSTPKDIEKYIKKYFEVNKLGYDKKFQNKANKEGLYVSLKINDKNIRIPIKELNNEYHQKNHKPKRSGYVYDKSRSHNKIKQLIKHQNEKKIELLDKRRNKDKSPKNKNDINISTHKHDSIDNLIDIAKTTNNELKQLDSTSHSNKSSKDKQLQHNKSKPKPLEDSGAVNLQEESNKHSGVGTYASNVAASLKASKDKDITGMRLSTQKARNVHKSALKEDLRLYIHENKQKELPKVKNQAPIQIETKEPTSIKVTTKEKQIDIQRKQIKIQSRSKRSGKLKTKTIEVEEVDTFGDM